MCRDHLHVRVSFDTYGVARGACRPIVMAAYPERRDVGVTMRNATPKVGISRWADAGGPRADVTPRRCRPFSELARSLFGTVALISALVALGALMHWSV